MIYFPIPFVLLDRRLHLPHLLLLLKPPPPSRASTHLRPPRSGGESTAEPKPCASVSALNRRKKSTASSIWFWSQFAEHNDAILLVVIPASQATEVASAKAIRIAKELDGECTRTVGVISKVDQASSEPKVLAAVQALFLNQGPRSTSDIPWVALIGQSVSIAYAQTGSTGTDNSLETAWRAKSESLNSILTGAPQRKLGILALVETLAQQIRKRMKIRLPNLLSGLQGKSQIVQDELFRLGEQMVKSSEGTKALALELCWEFEDKSFQHITTGEVRQELRCIDGMGLLSC